MYELFHRLADPPSARVRRWITEHGMLDQVRMRNLHYEEVAGDFTARGGRSAPALWDGKALVEGADAVIARLQADRQRSANGSP